MLAIPAIALYGVPASSNPQVQIENVQMAFDGPLEFTFSDVGTDATHYRIEHRPDLGGEFDWVPHASAVLTPLGDGRYHVLIPDPSGSTGFYRAVRTGPEGDSVVASFSTTATLEATEGETAVVIIQFSAPFTGTVRYRVSGSAEAGDFEPLSGEIHVENATSAALPVSFIDNDLADPLRHLTLTLESGDGLALGSRNQITILIDDNDADWQGVFSNENVTLAFTLHIIEVEGMLQATLRGGAGGFFPADPVPATLVWTEGQFELVVDEILFASGTTSFDAPLRLQLELSAADATDGQVVNNREIEGAASLQIEYPAKPHLNTASAGVFFLTRTPLAPSTVAVPLSPAP